MLEALVIGADKTFRPRTLGGNATATVVRSYRRLARTSPPARVAVDLPKLLESKDALAILIEDPTGDHVGAVAICTVVGAGAKKVLKVVVDVLGEVDPGHGLATALDVIARTIPSDGIACSGIRIKANGPFPCPAGYSYELRGRSGRVMKLKYSWN